MKNKNMRVEQRFMKSEEEKKIMIKNMNQMQIKINELNAQLYHEQISHEANINPTDTE